MNKNIDGFPSDKEILSNEFLEKYKNKQPNWGFNGLGYIVYKRTYARSRPDGTSEEWEETIERCIRGAQRIGANYTVEEAERLFDYIFNLKGCFGGRSLWQLGTPMVDRFCGNSLINCFYIAITKLEDFCFLFDNLMLGSGVGFSVRREHVHELPKVKDVIITHELTKDATFIVPDSRDGWTELLRKVLDAFFNTGKGFSYSTILVRGYGEPIKTFGGTASGPKILISGIEKICNVFRSRINKKLRSVDVLDICNIIGSIVVSGNVRRSSQIALGDADDYLFIRAKRWDLGNIPNWRSMSNNTIVADNFSYLGNDFWNGYNGNGEPYGLFNLLLTQSHGRLIDGPMAGCDLYPTDFDNATGGNPCNEISLCSAESCNLAELFLNNISSQNELIDCAKLLYKTQKAIAALNYLHDETNKIVHKNFRLGLGVTGICQSLNKIEWLDNCYRELRKFDREWSKNRKYPESIKLTTIKPSGTLSLLPGATSGVHPAYSKYFIRRVRIASSDILFNYCKDLGYKVDFVRGYDGSIEHHTGIIEFPCMVEDGTIIAENFSAIEQLELIKKLQTVWSDNSVSATVYYKKEELAKIKEWLNDNYSNSVKTISFLLHDGHGFKQAPLEEITKDNYNELIKNIKPIQLAKKALGKELLDGLECSSGSCPIR